MPNLVNELTVREYESKFREAEGLVVCALDGLSVAESEDLRSKMEERGVALQVVRNKLVRRVLEERGVGFPSEVLRGSTAIAWGDAEAAIHAAKVLAASPPRKAGKVRFKAGLLEGSLLGAEDTAALAEVPDRETLNAQVLGALQGPARGLAGVLQAPLSALCRVLQARIDQAGGAEDAG